jgi:BirA family biotin operon repressor/biotin-[acetyl-CoA-carboxylase] ligase
MALIPPIYWLDSVDSTQLELKRKLKESPGLEHLTSVSACTQHKGRGRGVSKWHDVPGNSVLLSVFLRWKRPISESFDVNRWVCGRLSSVVPSSVSFKWPNDLMVGDKKLGGMLIENHWGASGIKSSIVGLGMNLKSSPQDLKRSIAMDQFQAVSTDAGHWVEKILMAFASTPAEFNNPMVLRSSYEELLWGRDEWREYQVDAHCVEAKVKGVSIEGRLILEQKNGAQISGDVDAIKWMNPYSED